MSHVTIHSDLSLYLLIVSFYICDQNLTLGPTKYTKKISPCKIICQNITNINVLLSYKLETVLGKTQSKYENLSLGILFVIHVYALTLAK